MEEKNQEDFGVDGEDEFFGDDGDEEGGESNTMADRELAALQARLSTLGYQDGVDDGVQEAVQGGFDQGYAVGAAAGWEVGLLYGGATAAKAALSKAETSQSSKAGGMGGAHLAPAIEENRINDGASSVLPAGSRAERASEAGGSGDGAAPTALPGAASSPTDRRFVESDGKDAAESATAQDLQELVEELRLSSLQGPDGPALPDRVDVLRRLRLVGAVGAAVADGLEEDLR
ncbi:unnamed protein product [Scytosiphon promiscuus]